MQVIPVIEARHLSIDYRLGNQWANALCDISLVIHPMEIHGLVGESGSGKSTLALALMRYLSKNARITSGQVLFEGDNLLEKSDRQMQAIWGGQISLVPQDPLAALNPAYTVGEQIAEITEQHGQLTGKQARLKSIEMLERVRLADPEAVARKYPHQLSGGMQQRVTIAMALSTRPKLLILDEPTTALDVTTEATVLDLFRELIQDNDAAALYVSHNLGVIAQMCDQVTVLYAGEVMASGTVQDIYDRSIHPYTTGLLASIPRPTEGVETRLPTMDGIAPSLTERPTACVFAQRCPVAQAICFEQKPPLETIQPGRMVKCHRWKEIASGNLRIDAHDSSNLVSGIEPSDSKYVLTTHDVSKVFGQNTLWSQWLGKGKTAIQAVDDVSIRVRERSTLGIVGESGSGKTTLARCIVGLEPADEGEITLLDIPIAVQASDRPQDIRRNLQMVFQNPNDTLNPYLSVGQTLERTIRLLAPETLSREAANQRIQGLLDSVRLPADYADRYPGELSGGEKQRVAIARAFATHPALVVADEPTSALDVSVQAVILNLLKDMRAQQGASYIFISHDLRAVSYLADWLVVMYLGQIVEEGTTEQVYSVPAHPYTEALVSAIPEPNPNAQRKHIRLDGDIPSAANLPTGCRFHTRCPRKIGAICEQQEPPWQHAGHDHRIRCHIPINELARLQANPSQGALVDAAFSPGNKA
jgi:peptide/nickel transport system ATP-binding protein